MVWASPAVIRRVPAVARRQVVLRCQLEPRRRMCAAAAGTSTEAAANAGGSSSALHKVSMVALPSAAVACFAFAGYEAWTAFFGKPPAWTAFFGADQADLLSLRQQWDRDAVELDQKREAWVRRVVESVPAASSSGSSSGSVVGAGNSQDVKVLQEVHKMEALGPAGIHLKKGETVKILAEGTGMEVGFGVVRSSDGRTGIFPKAYLVSPDAYDPAAPTPKLH